MKSRTSVPGTMRVMWLPLVVYLPLTGLLAGWSLFGGAGMADIALFLAAGIVIWTFSEYWIHRLLLHTLPRGAVRRYVAGRHILHHRDPWGYPGIALLWVSLAIAGAVFGTLLLLLNLPQAATMTAGVMLGYLAYEYTHLASHLGTPGVSPWSGLLDRHHLVHHDVSARHNFAITLPFWDRVFRTKYRSDA